ncbi:microtubule integrity protein mal3 [Linderina macrospora]|uniref:Microtubule integrity protein mal3 n=1 Tax=Linderina macrospora TaxID=4868 RepID=A0ACC1JET8_9FUNG|nr:microtubule integrity protein mal3 [Linderina macrospora]
MSESRQSLIQWVNELLQTNYTKVEQLGSGAAYCQIIDSIYMDVPLNRVKFSANQQYEYIENFKILQNMIRKHKIDKPIDPTKLMKCRFQDNFEFLQWLKRFWDSYYSGQAYDALARRSGRSADVPANAASRPRSSASSAHSSSTGMRAVRPGVRPGAQRPPAAAMRPGSAGLRPGSRTGPGATASAHQVQELNRQLAEAKVLIETAEKERDFYFSKLREIEVYLQQLELEPGSDIGEMASHIQGILYSTDDSFVGEEEQVQGDLNDETYDPQGAAPGAEVHLDEEETF